MNGTILQRQWTTNKGIHMSDDFLSDIKDGLASIKPVTAKMIFSVCLDQWPSPAACVDFGVDSQSHYEALYYPIRAGEISEVELDKVLGDGPEITKLVQSCQSNPHKDIVFTTAYDCMEDGFDDDEGDEEE